MIYKWQSFFFCIHPSVHLRWGLQAPTSNFSHHLHASSSQQVPAPTACPAPCIHCQPQQEPSDYFDLFFCCCCCCLPLPGDIYSTCSLNELVLEAGFETKMKTQTVLRDAAPTAGPCSLQLAELFSRLQQNLSKTS